MGRPRCRLHPNSTVRQDGYYGSDDQYQRWKCVPDSASIHYLRQDQRLGQELPQKRVGGRTGACRECSRPWGPGDGVVKARTDFYTLRDKVEALLHLARGESYRKAGQLVRLRASQSDLRGEPPSESRSGRLTRDWVSQYAPILGDRFLEDEWPEVVVLDTVPFHRSNAAGTSSGKRYFVVFGALTYNDGTVKSLMENPEKTPKLLRLGVGRTESAATWMRFLAQMNGEPAYVVCDRSQPQLAGVRRLWSMAQIYPCTSHLATNVEDRLKAANLGNTNLARLLDRSLFTQPSNFSRFRVALDRLLANPGQLTKKQKKEVRMLHGWFQANNRMIQRTLHHWHRPVSIGGLERPLRHIKTRLYDRRRNFTNIPRLEHLLTLMTLDRRGQVDAHTWTEVLRLQHQRHQGTPPPRRWVDGTTLRLR